MSPNSVYTFNPLEDQRWPEFAARHPKASVFHTRGWLSALKTTYQYEPIAFTTSAPGADLENALVFCEIRSWITGRRLVSLPFSDHCEPLVENQNDLNELLLFIEEFRKRAGWRYVELRPALTCLPVRSGFHESDRYLIHRLDLNPSLQDLLGSFHKDCVQRKIRKAEREGLEYEAGRSDSQLQKLYGLLKVTRRRHGIPPQPIEWFRNLLSLVGDAARIHIASKNGLPVAGILTLSLGNHVVFKYGGSNASMHYLGGMAFLFWKSIQEAKLAGALEYDFGRSAMDNTGLIAFKEHWAARRSTLTHWCSLPPAKSAAPALWKNMLPRKLFACLPDRLQTAVGRLLYRHIG